MNAGTGTLNYSVVASTTDPNWSMPPSQTNGSVAAGSAGDQITVTFNTKNLTTAKSYSGTIQVQNAESPSDVKTIDVVLTMTPSSGVPIAQLSTLNLNPTVIKGGNPVADTFRIANVGTGTLKYRVVTSTNGNPNWQIVVDKTSGQITSVPDTVTVTYTTTQLDVGRYDGTVTVTDDATPPAWQQTIAVRLTVQPPASTPTIEVNPLALNPVSTSGQDAPPATFTVRNSGVGTLNYSITTSTDDPAWQIMVDPSSGSPSGELKTVTVTFNTRNLRARTYSGAITIVNSDDPAKSVTIPVNLLVNVPNTTADVSVSAEGPERAMIGVPFTYTVGVTNLGPDAASEVLALDQLPPEVTLNSYTVTQGSATETSPGVVQVDFGTLAVGSVATLTLTVTPNQLGSIYNFVAALGIEADPELDNNGTYTTTVVVPQAPDLTGKWVQATPWTTGGRRPRYGIQLAFDVWNAGPLPTAKTIALFYLSAQPRLDGSSKLFAYTVGALKAGQGAHLTKNLRLPAGVTPSGKYLIAVIDPSNRIQEFDESNNMVILGPLP
jgi:uncharacterized repeat protein (TIGR01451 family)